MRFLPQKTDPHPCALLDIQQRSSLDHHLRAIGYSFPQQDVADTCAAWSDM
jgi:hypothetical protein